MALMLGLTIELSLLVRLAVQRARTEADDWSSVSPESFDWMYE